MENAGEYKWERKCQMPIADHKFLNCNHCAGTGFFSLSTSGRENLLGMGSKYLQSFWLWAFGCSEFTTHPRFPNKYPQCHENAINAE